MQQPDVSCPFCQMVRGAIPTQKVYEDEHVLVVLDINPAAAGHTLLIPKLHVATLAELPLALCTYMASLCKQLSWTLLRELQAEGTTIFLTQGALAGQQAQQTKHLFFHIIPRKEKDGLQLGVFPQQPFSVQDLDDLKAVIIHGIKQVIEGGNEDSSRGGS